MVVWGDLLFLINFCMDFLCFYLSCLILHRRLPTLRACIASCIGGVYSVFALFLEVGGGLSFAIDIAVLTVMCLCVYLERGCKIGQLFRAVLLYFVVSALLGGVMTSLFSLFNEMDIISDGFDVSEGVDVWVFALLAIVGSAFTLKSGRAFRTRSKGSVVLEIWGEGKECELRALLDSGNLATEPISGKAVAFASLESCRDVLAKEEYDALVNFSLDEPSSELLSKIRLVPTRSIGGESLLPSKRFGKTYVKNNGMRKPIDVYIAFVPQNSLGDYEAIISDETII